MSFLSSLNSLRKFSKAERSSFPYWYNHWLAYNLVAFELGVWKFRYLFHDIEKPFLMKLWRDYSRVQQWHRYHNKHHLQYKNKKKIDWEALIIDWECSRFTKLASPKTAREQMLEFKGRMSEEAYNEMENKMTKILNKLGL